MSQTELNQIWQMWKRGAKYREISEVVGCGTSRIGYIISNQIKRSIGSGNWKRPAKQKEV